VVPVSGCHKDKIDFGAFLRGNCVDAGCIVVLCPLLWVLVAAKFPAGPAERYPWCGRTCFDLAIPFFPLSIVVSRKIDEREVLARCMNELPEKNREL
jgi:hypothetical protein